MNRGRTLEGPEPVVSLLLASINSDDRVGRRAYLHRPTARQPIVPLAIHPHVGLVSAVFRKLCGTSEHVGSGQASSTFVGSEERKGRVIMLRTRNLSVGPLGRMMGRNGRVLVAIGVNTIACMQCVVCSVCVCGALVSTPPHLRREWCYYL